MFLHSKALLSLATVFALSLNSVAFAAEKQVSQVQIDTAKEWLSSLALQAATWGAPIVTMYALRYHDAVGPNAKAAPNTIWRMEDISTPELSQEAGYVTPNVNVVYGFGFMDLRQEPIILHAPDSNNRYYMIQIVDMWTNTFAYVGGKATGYKGGTYALVGPNWKGLLPSGVKRINCPTPWILLQPRVHIYQQGKIDLTGAKQVLSKITTQGLSEYLGKSPLPPLQYNYPDPEPTRPELPVSVLQYKDPLQFWKLLSAALNENPPPQDQITALLPMFKPLGIELDKTWDPSQLPDLILDVMRDAATHIGSLLSHLPFGTAYHGAFLPPPSIGNAGNDYLTRAIVARIGLTANTPFESVYWMYALDKDGNPLSGANQYTMTFKEPIPYYEPGFWSITLYDSVNNYTVPNPIHRYMLGSDTPQLKKNADGSITLYIQKKSPGKDKESNWLPAPDGAFYLIPRSYAPKPETIRILTDVNSWPVPVIEITK
jgi:DNA sulfur modification protein DndE